jgi:hypothetical protein
MDEDEADFDIAPSQNLVPPHTHQSYDTNLEQPTKRVKTTHRVDDPQPDSQLSQLPDGVRKIPGPAGSLPPIHTTSAQSFPAKAVVLASQAESSQPDGLLIQSKIHKKTSSVPGNVGPQDDYISDFTRGPWLVMLQHSELPPFGMYHSTLLLKRIKWDIFIGFELTSY